MARSDLLLSLVQAGTRGDRPGFRRTLEALVADERGRQHHVVANQLAAYLEPARPEATTSMRPISSPPEGLLDELEPSRTLEDLVLPEVVRDACLHFLDEQRRADLLRSHGLEPRHRLLLIGPPGNGKTSLAEALAGELSLPASRRAITLSSSTGPFGAGFSCAWTFPRPPGPRRSRGFDASRNVRARSSVSRSGASVNSWAVSATQSSRSSAETSRVCGTCSRSP